MTKQFGQLRGIWLIVLVFALDQLTKHLAVANLNPNELVDIIPGFFALKLDYGKPLVFSFFFELNDWHLWFITAMQCVIAVGVLIWLVTMQAHRTWMIVAAALVSGAAFSSFYDLAVQGEILSFFVVKWQGHWAGIVFSFGEIALLIGALMMAVEWFWKEPKRAKEAKHELNNV